MSDQKIFPQKHIKKLNEFAQGYIESVEIATTEEIKKFILSSEQNIYEIEHEMENNSNLLKLKEQLKEASGPFTEAKSTETAKIKYCLFVLEGRGVRI
jgi:hypothetical protein